MSANKKTDISEIGASCVANNFRKTYRQILKYYDDIISESGLHGTQFPVMLAISRSQPVSVSNLAKIMDVDRTTISRSIKLLEKEGFIFFSHSSDSRVKNIALTAEGLKAFEHAVPLWQKAQNSILEKIGEDEWGNMLRGFEKLTEIVK